MGCNGEHQVIIVKVNIYNTLDFQMLGGLVVHATYCIHQPFNAFHLDIFQEFVFQSQ